MPKKGKHGGGKEAKKRMGKGHSQKEMEKMHKKEHK